MSWCSRGRHGDDGFPVTELRLEFREWEVIEWVIEKNIVA